MSLLVTLSLLTALNTNNLTPHKYENTHKQSSTVSSEIANILPSDTPLVGFVSTKVEDWKTLNRFALFKTAFTTAANLLPPNVNLELVVQSSLGEKIGLVMMPVKSKKVSIDTNFLMLAPVKDDRLFQPFLDNIKANKRQYKGVTILEWKSLKSVSTLTKAAKSQLQLFPNISNAKTVASLPTIPLPPQVVQPKPTIPSLPDLNKREQSLAIALLPGYVVLASTARPIEQLIDTPSNNTLAQNPNFQRTRQNPHFVRSLFTIYENPTLFASILDSFAKEPTPFSIFDIAGIKPEQFKQYSSIDGLMWVQPSGLHLQLNTYHRQAIARSTFKTNNELLAHIPAPNYSTFTGRNIQQQWQLITTAFNANPTFKDGLAKFYDSVRSTTKIDVERDILAWMNGEYAFFSYPTKHGLFNSAHNKFNLNLGMGFMVQTSDRTAAETSLKKLDAAIKSFDKGISITNHNINNNRVTDWSAQKQSLFAYTWIDNKTLLITTGVSAIKELLTHPRHQLAKDYNFTTATSFLPHPNQGYFYMNMGSSLSWLYNLFPDTFNTQYFQIFKESIGSIYSISGTTSTHGNREQSDALIVLAPARK